MIPRTCSIILHYKRLFPVQVVLLALAGSSVTQCLSVPTIVPILTRSTIHDPRSTIHDPRSTMPSLLQCIPWLAVLGTECLTIVILNVIIIIAFVKQRQPQRRSKYLIIHQAIVDLLVGLVYGPLMIERCGNICDLWGQHRPNNTWLLILEYGLGLQVDQFSLLNLAFISLERAHATFRPFKHRFIKKWVYGVIITVIWLVPAVMNSFVLGIVPSHFFFTYDAIIVFAFYLTLLFVIIVCYTCICLKVRCNRLPRHHGAAGVRERKLTGTLFLVTFGSLITFLPRIAVGGFWASILESVSSFYDRLSFNYLMVIATFVVANSLINPIIYAIRMPEVRTSILVIIFRRARNPINPINIPLQNL